MPGTFRSENLEDSHESRPSHAPYHEAATMKIPWDLYFNLSAYSVSRRVQWTRSCFTAGLKFPRPAAMNFFCYATESSADFGAYAGVCT